MATYGHSKEKRSDCPLLTLALVLDGSGFVRRSEVLAGSIVEGEVLQEVLQRLAVPPGALIVMDCGAASEENLKWLREQGYRYLAVSLERTRQFDVAAALSLTTAGKQQIQVQKVVSEDGAEVRLYCYSEARKEKEQAMLTKACTRFEQHLKELHEGLSRPRTHKKIEAVWSRIGRLKANSSGAGQHYQIEVAADESGQKATAVSWERRPVAGSKLTHPGVYCLRSNQTDWDAEAMWRTYIMLTDLEGVSFPEVGAGTAADLSPEAAPLQRPSVHHRARLPVGAGDSAPSAGAWGTQLMAFPALHPCGAAPCHRHLSPC